MQSVKNAARRLRGKRDKLSPLKGEYGRHITKTGTGAISGRSYEYHATKGWRSYRKVA